jgi:hypothetical protein
MFVWLKQRVKAINRFDSLFRVRYRHSSFKNQLVVDYAERVLASSCLLK